MRKSNFSFAKLTEFVFVALEKVGLSYAYSKNLTLPVESHGDRSKECGDTY